MVFSGSQELVSMDEEEKGKPKLETHEKINILGQGILPIVTALVTGAFFLYSAYYVGEVEVKVPETFNNLEVHAFNDKGNETVFHNARFQLPPDRYHFEVQIDSRPKEKFDEGVGFGHKTILNCLSLKDNPTVIDAKESGRLEEMPAPEEKAVKSEKKNGSEQLSGASGGGKREHREVRVREGSGSDKPDKPDKPDFGDDDH